MAPANLDLAAPEGPATPARAAAAPTEIAFEAADEVELEGVEGPPKQGEGDEVDELFMELLDD